MFYFCPYPPSTQARYDLLQVQYLPPSQWFQHVARAYTFLTTHIHAYMHTCTHRNEQDSGPLFLQSRGTYRLVCGEATPILRGEGTAAAAGVSAGGQEEEQQQQQGWRRLRALGWGQEYG